nr:reverse transcriptase domain-containing protein [Tanacetum cinerariifolium]
MQHRSSSRLVGNLSSNPTPSTNPNPKGRNRRRSKQRIEDFDLEELSPPIVTMADQRIMAQLLQAPTEGYEDAIVVPAITAANFELKHGLLTLVQNKQFFGHDKEDPHAHVRYFNKITSTLKFLNVLNTLIKLMLFPFSLEGAARIWLEKEPPRSIFTWDDLVSKFINQFFHPPKTTNLRNEITNFQQRFNESFSEAWDRFKDLLRSYPHHAIIEIKSKVRYSHNKPVVAKVSTNTSTSGISPDVAELKDMVKALLIDKKGQNQSPALVKAVEKSCVTCGGAHSYRNCPATDGNVYRDNIQEFVSQASAVNYNQEKTNYRPPMMSNKIRPPGFPPVPNNQNVQRNNQNRFIPNQNRGNNFNQGPVYQPSVFQPLPYQAPAPQTQGVSKEDFSAYVKANDAIMRNMQTQELADRSISCPVGVAEDVYVKIGRALIDVFKGDLTLRVGKEAITFNLDQTSRYSANYSDMTAKRIDVIDMACEEYSHEVLGFSDTVSSGNPTSFYDSIVSTTSPTLTPFENSDFLLEEVDAFLAIEDDPTYPEFYQPYLDPEGDILLLEAFLNDDPTLPPPNQGNYLPEVCKELKICEAKSDKSSVDEPLAVKLKDLPPTSNMHSWKDQEKTTFTCPYGTFAYRRMPFGLCNAPGTFQRCVMEIFHDMIEKTMEVFMDDLSVFGNSFESCLSYLERMMKRCEDTNLCLNWEKSHFMVQEAIVLGHKISKQGIEINKAKVDVITKLPHSTTVKGVRSFLGHAGFYRRFIKDFSKIARPMTRLLEKDTHSFSIKSVLRHFKHSKESLLKLLS